MDRTNIFFLVVAGGAAWWLFNEYQKQTAAQRRLQLQQRATQALGAPRVIDYAEQIATGYI